MGKLKIQDKMETYIKENIQIVFINILLILIYKIGKREGYGIFTLKYHNGIYEGQWKNGTLILFLLK